MIEINRGSGLRVVCTGEEIVLLAGVRSLRVRLAMSRHYRSILKESGGNRKDSGGNRREPRRPTRVRWKGS
jgi:hypothetical protein